MNQYFKCTAETETMFSSTFKRLYLRFLTQIQRNILSEECVGGYANQVCRYQRHHLDTITATRPKSDEPSTLQEWRTYALTLEKFTYGFFTDIQDIHPNICTPRRQGPSSTYLDMAESHFLTMMLTLLALKHYFPNVCRESVPVYDSVPNERLIDQILSILPAMINCDPDVQQVINELPSEFLSHSLFDISVDLPLIPLCRDLRQAMERARNNQAYFTQGGSVVRFPHDSFASRVLDNYIRRISGVPVRLGYNPDVITISSSDEESAHNSSFEDISGDEGGDEDEGTDRVHVDEQQNEPPNRIPDFSFAPPSPFSFP